jgi:hypothetical protein
MLRRHGGDGERLDETRLVVDGHGDRYRQALGDDRGLQLVELDVAKIPWLELPKVVACGPCVEAGLVHRQRPPEHPEGTAAES